MNRVALLLLCGAVAVAGSWITLQTIESAKTQQRIAALQKSILEKDKALEDARAEIAGLKMKNGVYADQIAALNKRLPATADPGGDDSKAQEGGTAKKKEGKGLFGGFMTKLLDNPDMKEMMRKQQAGFLRKSYADFVNQLGLSPEQAEQFFELLGDRQIAMMEQGMQLFKDGATNLEQKAGEVAKGQEELSRPLEEFLGKDGLAQFKDYESTVGDRMVLDQFRLQNGTGPGAIPEEQAGTLLQIMQEERKNSAQGFAGNPNDPKNMKLLLSDENMDQYFQAQEDLNARVVARAASVLSPEQLDALTSFQKGNLEMQKMGMKMSREMLKPKE